MWAFRPQTFWCQGLMFMLHEDSDNDQKKNDWWNNTQNSQAEESGCFSLPLLHSGCQGQKIRVIN